MKFGLRHIRYFIAVAEELHFRRAASRLGIAQPALSRAIQHLEAELNIVLFERTNRHVKLTDAGREFYKGSQAIMNNVNHTIENARNVSEGRIGTLRIGYTDFAIAGSLPNLLREFSKAQPGIILQPHHDVTRVQLKKMEEGTLDIGFVTGPISLPSYEQILIQKDAFICFVHKNHHLAGRRSIKLSELANEDFIHGPYNDWEHFYSYLIPLCRDAGFMPNIVQEVFNSDGILGLVASGMGVTILTDSSKSTAISGLTSIPIEDVTHKLTTVALWKNGSPDSATMKLVEFLRQHELT